LIRLFFPRISFALAPLFLSSLRRPFPTPAMQNLPVHVINAGAKRESGKKAQMGNIAAAKVCEQGEEPSAA